MAAAAAAASFGASGGGASGASRASSLSPPFLLLPVSHCTLRLSVGFDGEGTGNSNSRRIAGVLSFAVNASSLAVNDVVGFHAKAGLRIERTLVDGKPVETCLRSQWPGLSRDKWQYRKQDAFEKIAHIASSQPTTLQAEQASNEVRDALAQSLVCARKAPDVLFAWPGRSAHVSTCTVDVHFEVETNKCSGWLWVHGKHGTTVYTSDEPGAAPSWTPCIVGLPCTWVVEVEHDSVAAAHVAPAARMSSRELVLAPGASTMVSSECVERTTCRFFVATPTNVEQMLVIIGSFGAKPAFHDVEVEHLPVFVHGLPASVASLRGWLAQLLAALDKQVGSIRRPAAGAVANTSLDADGDVAMDITAVKESDREKNKNDVDDEDDADDAAPAGPCAAVPLRVIVIPHSTMPPRCTSLPPPHGMHIIVGAERLSSLACPHHHMSALREIAVTVTRAFFLSFLSPDQASCDNWLLDALALTWCERTFELPWVGKAEIDVRARRRRHHSMLSLRRGCPPLSYADYGSPQNPETAEKNEIAYAWDMRARSCSSSLALPIGTPEYGYVPLGDAQASRLCSPFGGEDPLGECTLEYSQNLARAALLLRKYEKGNLRHNASSKAADTPLRVVLKRLALNFRKNPWRAADANSPFARYLAEHVTGDVSQLATEFACAKTVTMKTTDLVEECKSRMNHMDDSFERVLKFRELIGMGYTRLEAGHSTDDKKKRVNLAVRVCVTEPARTAFKSAVEGYGGGCVLKVRVRERDGNAADHFYVVAPEEGSKGSHLFHPDLREKFKNFGDRLGDIQGKLAAVGQVKRVTAYQKKRKRDMERERAKAAAEEENQRLIAEAKATGAELPTLAPVVDGKRRMGSFQIPEDLNYKNCKRAGVSVEVDPDGEWSAEIVLRQKEASWVSSVHSLLRACRSASFRSAFDGSAATDAGEGTSAADGQATSFVHAPGCLVECMNNMSMDVSESLRMRDDLGYQAVSILMAMAADDGSGAGVHGVHNLYGKNAARDAHRAGDGPQRETHVRLRCAAYGALVTMIRGGDSAAARDRMLIWRHRSSDGSLLPVEGGRNSRAPCVQGIVGFMRQRFQVNHFCELHAQKDLRSLPAPRPGVAMAAWNLESRVVAVGLAETLVGTSDGRYTPQKSCEPIIHALEKYFDAPALVPSPAMGSFSDAPFDAERLSGLLVAAGRCRPKERDVWKKLCTAVERHVRRASWLSGGSSGVAFEDAQTALRHGIRALCDLALALAPSSAAPHGVTADATPSKAPKDKRLTAVKYACSLCEQIVSDTGNGLAVRLEAQRCWLWLQPYAVKNQDATLFRAYSVAQSAIAKAVFGWRKNSGESEMGNQLGDTSERALRLALLAEATSFAEEWFESSHDSAVTASKANIGKLMPGTDETRVRKTFRLLARAIFAADMPALSEARGGGGNSFAGPQLAVDGVPDWLMEDAATTWGSDDALKGIEGEKIPKQREAVLTNQYKVHEIASSDASFRLACFRLLRALCSAPAYLLPDLQAAAQLKSRVKKIKLQDSQNMINQQRRQNAMKFRGKLKISFKNRPTETERTPEQRSTAQHSAPNSPQPNSAQQKEKERRRKLIEEGNAMVGKRVAVRWISYVPSEEDQAQARAQGQPCPPGWTRPADKNEAAPENTTDKMITGTISHYFTKKMTFKVLYDDGEYDEHDLMGHNSGDSVQWEFSDVPEPAGIPSVGKRKRIAAVPRDQVSPSMKRQRSSASLKKKAKPVEDPTQKKLQKALNILMAMTNKIAPKHRPHMEWFDKKVDPWLPTDLKWGCPGYYNVIKRPMDLGTIKTHLKRDIHRAAAGGGGEEVLASSHAGAVKMDVEGGVEGPVPTLAALPSLKAQVPGVRYTNLAQVRRDILLVFSNVKLINPAGTPCYHSAELMENLFNKEWTNKYGEGNELAVAAFEEDEPGIGALPPPEERSKEEKNKHARDLRTAENIDRKRNGLKPLPSLSAAPAVKEGDPPIFMETTTAGEHGGIAANAAAPILPPQNPPIVAAAAAAVAAAAAATTTTLKPTEAAEAPPAKKLIVSFKFKKPSKEM